MKTEPPVVVNGANDAKQEEPAVKNEDTGNADQAEYNGEDANDDVEFNMGSGNDYGSNAAREGHGPGIKEDG